MAEKFGYSSPQEFAVHVASISKKERETLLDEFYGLMLKKKSSCRNKSKQTSQIKEEQSINANQEETVPNGADHSGERKRNIPRTVRRTARASIKRKAKGLQFQEESPPKKVCPEGDSVKEAYLVSAETSDFVSPDTSSSVKLTCALPVDQDSTMDIRLQNSGDAMCLEKDSVCDGQLKEHRGKCAKESLPIDLNLDSDAIIDRLFSDDGQPVVPASRPCNTVTSQSSPTMSKQCTPSVSILGKVSQKLDFKPAVVTDHDLNIDELLFGF